MSTIENLPKNSVDRRQAAVLQIPTNTLDGFLPPTPELIFGKIEDRLRLGGGLGVFFDLDDASFVSEPYLRNRLERNLRENGASVPHVSINGVIAAGGRHFQVAEYQNAVRQIGLDKKFGDYHKQVATSEELHARMRPVKGAVKFQRQLEKMGFPTCGYPTARPEKIIPVSAAALYYFRFSEAPVVDVRADLKDPSDAKVAFMKKVFEHFSDAKKILFFDDHVQTAIKLQETFPGKIISIVPIVPRNKHQIPDLEKHGIIYGSFEDIIRKLKTQGFGLNQ